MSKWLSFILTGEKPKTKVYSVISKCSGAKLGEIAWYTAWRHYCFSPTLKIVTVHSDRCLFEISEFVRILNEEHKKRKVKNGGRVNN